MTTASNYTFSVFGWIILFYIRHFQKHFLGDYKPFSLFLNFIKFICFRKHVLAAQSLKVSSNCSIFKSTATCCKLKNKKGPFKFLSYLMFNNRCHNLIFFNSNRTQHRCRCQLCKHIKKLYENFTLKEFKFYKHVQGKTNILNRTKKNVMMVKSRLFSFNIWCKTKQTWFNISKNQDSVCPFLIENDWELRT